MTKSPKLIVLSGLPGVGKSTVAKAIASEFSHVYLRVDSIETPFAQRMKVEGEGYDALANVARENLMIGNSVLVDLVNPLHVSRDLFRRLAQESGATIIQFECMLPDAKEHRRRVENRASTDQHDPTWDEVTKRNYEAWDERLDGHRIIIDMTNKETAVAKIKEAII